MQKLITLMCKDDETDGDRPYCAGSVYVVTVAEAHDLQSKYPDSFSKMEREPRRDKAIHFAPKRA